MKNFQRSDHSFSLCGLNCGLCSMKLDCYCPGCGGGAGNQGCAIAKCSMQHDRIEYCHLCREYPCEKYDGIDEFDSFITHRNQLKDIKRFKEMGLVQYHAELDRKIEILKCLLTDYNDGRHKSFFCIAVNLLALQDVEAVMNKLSARTCSDNLTPTERAAVAAELFQSVAEQKAVKLKLNKKAVKKRRSESLK